MLFLVFALVLVDRELDQRQEDNRHMEAHARGEAARQRIGENGRFLARAARELPANDSRLYDTTIKAYAAEYTCAPFQLDAGKRILQSKHFADPKTVRQFSWIICEEARHNDGRRFYYDFDDDRWRPESERPDRR